MLIFQDGPCTIFRQPFIKLKLHSVSILSRHANAARNRLIFLTAHFLLTHRKCKTNLGLLIALHHLLLSENNILGFFTFLVGGELSLTINISCHWFHCILQCVDVRDVSAIEALDVFVFDCELLASVYSGLVIVICLYRVFLNGFDIQLLRKSDLVYDV